MPQKYRIELTDTAARVYRKLYEEARACTDRGDESNAKVTLFKMVDEAINKIIPHEPFNRDRALAAPLSNIFRIKKGRIRICYVGSSEQQRIVILYISEVLRKEGDVSDPYRVFTRLFQSGVFDQVLSSLGLRLPRRPGPARPSRKPDRG